MIFYSTSFRPLTNWIRFRYRKNNIQALSDIQLLSRFDFHFITSFFCSRCQRFYPRFVDIICNKHRENTRAYYRKYTKKNRNFVSPHKIEMKWQKVFFDFMLAREAFETTKKEFLCIRCVFTEKMSYSLTRQMRSTNVCSVESTEGEDTLEFYFFFTFFFLFSLHLLRFPIRRTEKLLYMQSENDTVDVCECALVLFVCVWFLYSFSVQITIHYFTLKA